MVVQHLKNRPVEDVDLEYISQLDTPWYFQEYEEPTVRRVAQEAAQIEHADLRHPIILSPDGDLLDGAHRLGKAYREGKRTIKAKRLAVMPPPDKVLRF